MKKIFMIFALMEFIVFPYTACADQTSRAYEWQCINKIIKELNPDNHFSNNDYFCINPRKSSSYTYKWDCFHADNKACVKNTTVCILGSPSYLDVQEITDPDLQYISKPEKRPEGTYTYQGLLLGYRTCAISYEGSGSDNWYEHYNPKTKAITDCTNTKWKKNDTINKTNEVMVWDNKPVLDDDNTPSEYLVKHYNSPTYPNICVGYYCAGADGKYTEPCDDGTCSANCNNAGGGADDNSGGSAPGGNDGGNDGGENGGNANAKEPDDNKIHRHTVDPWLKALDAYMSSCKK